MFSGSCYSNDISEIQQILVFILSGVAAASALLTDAPLDVSSLLKETDLPPLLPGVDDAFLQQAQAIIQRLASGEILDTPTYVRLSIYKVESAYARLWLSYIERKRLLTWIRSSKIFQRLSANTTI